MIVRFRLGNITETRVVHGKLAHHAFAGRKRDVFKQLHVSVEFAKYGKHVISSCAPSNVVLIQLFKVFFCRQSNKRNFNLFSNISKTPLASAR